MGNAHRLMLIPTGFSDCENNSRIHLMNVKLVSLVT